MNNYQKAPAFELLTERHYPEIEHRIGRSFSAREVASLLGLPLIRIDKMRKDGDLIHYPSIEDGSPRLPWWQFEVENRRVLPWIGAVIAAYGGNGWGMVDFLTVTRMPERKTYLQMMVDTKSVQEVLAAAKRTDPR